MPPAGLGAEGEYQHEQHRHHDGREQPRSDYVGAVYTVLVDPVIGHDAIS